MRDGCIWMQFPARPYSPSKPLLALFEFSPPSQPERMPLLQLEPEGSIVTMDGCIRHHMVDIESVAFVTLSYSGLNRSVGMQCAICSLSAVYVQCKVPAVQALEAILAMGYPSILLESEGTV